MTKLRKYGLTLVATTSLVTIVLLATGWGSAVAAQVSSVFITNTGAAQAVPVQEVGTVPVHEQGTASVNVTNATVPVHEQGTAIVQVQGTAAVRSADTTSVLLRTTLQPATGTEFDVSSAKEVRVFASTSCGSTGTLSVFSDESVVGSISVFPLDFATVGCNSSAYTKTFELPGSSLLVTWDAGAGDTAKVVVIGRAN